MQSTSSETLFRQAAEAEGGMSISAGARVMHVRLAVESGRAVVVDLSGVPEDNRTALITEIKDLVHKASLRAASADTRPSGVSAKEPN
jgi:hypothetical protein